MPITVEQAKENFNDATAFFFKDNHGVLLNTPFEDIAEIIDAHQDSIDFLDSCLLSLPQAVEAQAFELIQKIVLRVREIPHYRIHLAKNNLAHAKSLFQAKNDYIRFQASEQDIQEIFNQHKDDVIFLEICEDAAWHRAVIGADKLAANFKLGDLVLAERLQNEVKAGEQGPGMLLGYAAMLTNAPGAGAGAAGAPKEGAQDHPKPKYLY